MFRLRTFLVISSHLFTWLDSSFWGSRTIDTDRLKNRISVSFDGSIQVSFFLSSWYLLRVNVWWLLEADWTFLGTAASYQLLGILSLTWKHVWMATDVEIAPRIARALSASQPVYFLRQSRVRTFRLMKRVFRGAAAAVAGSYRSP